MINKHLRSIVNLSVNHTGKMLSGIIIVTFILGYLVSSLQLNIGFDYLLSDNNPRIESLNLILDEFENDSNLLLLASGSEDSLRSFAYRIKPVLESFDDWVSAVHTHTPIEFLRKNILKLMNLNQLDNLERIFIDPNLISFLFNLNNVFENTYLHSNNGLISHRDEQNTIDFLDRLHMFIGAQKEIMFETEEVDVGQKAVDAIIFGERLHFSPNRDMLLIIIEPGFNMHLSATALIKKIDGIKDIINKTAIQHGIKAGLVGPLVKVRDYYIDFLSGFFRIFILLLIGFSFTLIISFRIWSIPFVCISTMIVGIVWTLGIISIFMQSINLILILALIIVILVGLGNCILLISGFLEKRKHGLNIFMSMQETLQRLGPSVIVSGSVVGLTFLALIFSEIKVFQDLGIIAGIGIIISTMVIIILLPSMLILLEKLNGTSNLSYTYKDISYPIFGRGAQWITKYRLIVVISFLFITGLIFYKGMQKFKNTNLLNLGLHDADSIKIEDKLIASFGMSSSLISFPIDNLETARSVTEKAREIMSIGWVESITDYIPNEAFNDEKFRYIRELRRKIKFCEVRKQLSSHDMNMYRKEIERLEANIIELQDFSLIENQLKIYEKTIQMVGDGTANSSQGILSPFINALDTGMNRLKLTYFQEQFSSAFKSTVLEMANTEPLTVENLPLGIRTRFMGENDNIFRINIYPKQNIWINPTFLSRFVNETRSITEKMTGWPIIFVELRDSMGDYGFQSIRLILLSMMLLLIIGLRSLKYSLIIILSIISGFIWLLGILIMINIPFYLMYICIMPIILSMGMNNGIHIFQRWKQEKNMGTVYRSTGKAIIITTITILAMALPFWVTNFFGLANIISVLIIGLICSLVAQLIIFPSLLSEATP